MLLSPMALPELAADTPRPPPVTVTYVGNPYAYRHPQCERVEGFAQKLLRS